MKPSKEKTSEYNRQYYLKNKEKRKLYIEKNKEHIRKKNKKRYKKKHERRLESRKIYYDEHKNIENQQRREYHQGNKEKLHKQHSRYCKIHREEINAYQVKKRKNDIHYRITGSLRSRLRIALVNHHAIKSCRTLELLGCSPEFLKQHLESLWTDGMTWDNYGLYGWHIDHIKPCASFDLTNVEQQKECFHWSNLSPMWAKDNLEKNSCYKGKVIRRKS